MCFYFLSLAIEEKKNLFLSEYLKTWKISSEINWPLLLLHTLERESNWKILWFQSNKNIVKHLSTICHCGSQNKSAAMLITELAIWSKELFQMRRFRIKGIKGSERENHFHILSRKSSIACSKPPQNTNTILLRRFFSLTKIQIQIH